MPAVLEAFAYLFTTSWRNRLRRRLAQLRNPRYALALCAGAAYIALLLIRPSSFRTPASPAPDSSLTGVLALASSVGLALVAAKWWLLGAPSVSLAFSPAEVQFLFPAPIRRRDLVLYRVLSTQVPLLVSATFVTLVIRRGGPGLPAGLRIIGLWVLFSTLFLHQMVATLVRTGAAERGRGLTRNAPALAIIGGAMLVMVVTVGRAVPPIHSFTELPLALSAVGRALDTPIPRAILAPFRWMLAPAYAHSPAIWARAIGPALAILVLHYLWVLSADATFETAAVDASARRAARLAVVRATGGTGGLARGTARGAPKSASRPWFPLSDTGPAWMAILWKNTVNLTRGVAIGLVLRMVAAITILIVAFRSAGVFGAIAPNAAATPGTIVAAIALLGAAYLSFLGPLAIRNDFRQDLAYLPVLRTFPLRGRTVVLAEILSPTLALSALQVALLLLAYLLTLHTVEVYVALSTRTLALAGAVLVLPLLNAVSFTIQNTLTLLFPAWTRSNTTLPAGFELMGQRLLMAFASLVALLLALVPPALVATVVAWLIGGSLVATIAVCTVAAAGTAILELAVAWSWLGRVYERTDATMVVV